MTPTSYAAAPTAARGVAAGVSAAGPPSGGSANIVGVAGGSGVAGYGGDLRARSARRGRLSTPGTCAPSSCCSNRPEGGVRTAMGCRLLAGERGRHCIGWLVQPHHVQAPVAHSRAIQRADLGSAASCGPLVRSPARSLQTPTLRWRLRAISTDWPDVFSTFMTDGSPGPRTTKERHRWRWSGWR